jgi:hypothetical protein
MITRTIYERGDLLVGDFHCPPGDPLWREQNVIGSGHLVVFPGTGVWITQSGRDPLVADPNHVVFYNRGQTYRRARRSFRMATRSSCAWCSSTIERDSFEWSWERSTDEGHTWESFWQIHYRRTTP